MKITKREDVIELTMLLTPYEAQRIMGDFNPQEEPSAPGKVLYSALAGIVTNAETAKAAHDRA